MCIRDRDKVTRAQLTRGERMVEILKQNQYVPMNVEKQIAIIYAGTKGYLDEIEAEKVTEFEKGLFNYLDANNAADLKSITDEGKISNEVRANLDEAIAAYKGGFTA